MLNASFVSNADHLAGGDRVQLWVHGHTHDSFDYRLNGTRVVCNPRGYAKGGVNENAHFDPHFIVETVACCSTRKSSRARPATYDLGQAGA